MVWIIVSISLIFLLLILLTRDNIFASLLLTGIGVVVAISTAFYLGPLAFILVSLVYIVAALTLVVIAAATLGDVKETRVFRSISLAGAVLVATPVLATIEGGAAPGAVGFDFRLVPLLAAFVVFILKIATELSI